MNVFEYPKGVFKVPLRLLRLPYTLYQSLMTMDLEPQTRQEEARRAFLEDVIGRAKGLAGFVMGDDDLIARGQVDRAKAGLRTEALTSESIAELRDRAADKRLTEERDRAADERRRVAQKEAERKISAAQEASRKKGEAAKRAAKKRGATKIQADAKRMALVDAEKVTEREFAARVQDADVVEQVAENAKREAEILGTAREARKS